MTVAAPPTRVIIADDDAFVRRAIRDELQAHEIVVIGEAGSGREAIELAVHYRPDVLVLDIVMPGIDGVAATIALQQRVPDVRILLLTGCNDDDLAVTALRAGATGFRRKDAGIDALAADVERVSCGELVVEATLVGALLSRLRALPERGIGLRPVSTPLTDREWEVLDALCVGLSGPEIAAAFVLSRETVRSHVKAIVRKLGVHGEAGAIAAAPGLRHATLPPQIIEAGGRRR